MRIFRLELIPNEIMIILRTVYQLKLTISADVESVFTGRQNTDNDQDDAHDEHECCQSTARSHFDETEG